MRENGFENLGFYSLCVIYVFFALASLFMGKVLTRLKAKTSIAIGSTAYALWIFSISLTVISFKYKQTAQYLSAGFVNFIVMLCSIFCGIGAAFLWVAQGKYLSDCAMVCQEKKGLYQSIFWSMNSLGSALLSNFLTSFILAYFSEEVLFIIAGIIAVVAVVIFFLLPDPIMNKDTTKTDGVAA